METPDLIAKTSAELFAAIIAAKTNRSPRPLGVVTVTEFAGQQKLSPVQASRILSKACADGTITREKWNENGHNKYVYRLNSGTTARAVSSRARGKQAAQ